MDAKSFVIGIIVGFVIMLGVSTYVFLAYPYTSIEEVCFDQSFTPEEYEECLRMLIDI